MKSKSSIPALDPVKEYEDKEGEYGDLKSNNKIKKILLSPSSQTGNERERKSSDIGVVKH